MLEVQFVFTEIMSVLTIAVFSLKTSSTSVPEAPPSRRPLTAAGLKKITLLSLAHHSWRSQPPTSLETSWRDRPYS